MERGNLFLMKGVKKGEYIYSEKRGERRENTKQNYPIIKHLYRTSEHLLFNELFSFLSITKNKLVPFFVSII